jgi:peptide/nickel transport system substrate-binding protein
VIRRSLLGALVILCAASGCTRRTPETGPIDIAAIGTLSAAPDADHGPLSAGDALLIDATSEGLVTFDAAGQIEPALAERWIVTDDGLGYIFRLRDVRWRDGKPVTAEAVARRLRAASRPTSRNAMRPALTAISETSAVTPQVIDIRLKRPFPDFLGLLGRPELTVRRAREDGTDPYHIVTRKIGVVRLEAAPRSGLPVVTLRGERAARTVARFAAGQADLVIGGTIGSLPLVRAAALGSPFLRFDPVRGLYGLVIAGDGGILADPVLRRALLMALDGDALVRSAALPGVTAGHGLLPADLPFFRAPPLPDWLSAPPQQRQQLALATIRAWTSQHGGPPRIAIARPNAVGDRIMVALAARQWRALGIDVRLVAAGERADLRLIDEIAPIAAPEWYLGHFTCKATSACSPVGDAALATADDGQLHAALTGEAARLMLDQAPFFPLASPARWSLVRPGLDGYHDNAVALHPLAMLRARPAE